MKVEFHRNGVISLARQCTEFFVPRVGDHIATPPLSARYSERMHYFDGVVQEIRVHYADDLSIELVEVRVA
jgi:hypothetical protein